MVEESTGPRTGTNAEPKLVGVSCLGDLGYFGDWRKKKHRKQKPISWHLVTLVRHGAGFCGGSRGQQMVAAKSLGRSRLLTAVVELPPHQALIFSAGGLSLGITSAAMLRDSDTAMDGGGGREGSGLFSPWLFLVLSGSCLAPCRWVELEVLRCLTCLARTGQLIVQDFGVMPSDGWVLCCMDATISDNAVLTRTLQPARVTTMNPSSEE